MHWLGVGLVCLVIVSFSLLLYAQARARQPRSDEVTDPAMVALRDDVMGRISLREAVRVEPRSDDSFHVEWHIGAGRDGHTLASVTRLYFAIADAPENRDRLVGEYIEGLMRRTRT